MAKWRIPKIMGQPNRGKNMRRPPGDTLVIKRFYRW